MQSATCILKGASQPVMLISVEKRRANFSSVTDSVPFRSALLIFLTDYCNNKKQHSRLNMLYYSKMFCYSQELACNTHHVPEGGACALASGVVLQNGRIVD